MLWIGLVECSVKKDFTVFVSSVHTGVVGDQGLHHAIPSQPRRLMQCHLPCRRATLSSVSQCVT